MTGNKINTGRKCSEAIKRTLREKKLNKEVA